MADDPPRRLIPWGKFPETDESLWAELAAVTRRAIIPGTFVQIYKTHPTLQALLNRAKTDG